jgi:hypothetical protein
VSKSGNSEAAETLESFVAELGKDRPGKGVLMSLLSGMAATLPALASATEVVENVRKLVTGIRAG